MISTDRVSRAHSDLTLARSGFDKRILPYERDIHIFVHLNTLIWIWSLAKVGNRFRSRREFEFGDPELHERNSPAHEPEIISRKPRLPAHSNFINLLPLQISPKWIYHLQLEINIAKFLANVRNGFARKFSISIVSRQSGSIKLISWFLEDRGTGLMKPLCAN